MTEEATFYIWCEWICTKCSGIHRVRFSVLVESRSVYQLKKAYSDNGIRISDIAFNMKKKSKLLGSRVYVKAEEEIETIFTTLRNYMLNYYAIEAGSLKMELCKT